MEQKINQALVQLENDLQSLVAARKSVEDTIKSSSELQKVVGEYVASVKTLCDRLQSWEDNLRGRESSLGHECEAAIVNIKHLCAETIESFSGKLNEIETSFKNNTKDILDSFSEQNRKLAERVEELNTLRDDIKKVTTEIENVKSSLEKISEDLKDSQDGQDKVLEEIKQKVLDLPNTIQQSSSKIIQEVSSARESLNELLTQTNNTLDAVNGKADSLAQNIANLTSLCHDVNTSVDTLKERADTIISQYSLLKEQVGSSSQTIVSKIGSIGEKLEAQDKFILREFSSFRKQNMILLIVNTILLLSILGFVLHIAGIL